MFRAPVRAARIRAIPSPMPPLGSVRAVCGLPLVSGAPACGIAFPLAFNAGWGPGGSLALSVRAVCGLPLVSGAAACGIAFPLAFNAGWGPGGSLALLRCSIGAFRAAGPGPAVP